MNAEAILPWAQIGGAAATVIVACIIFRQSRHTKKALEDAEKTQFATLLNDLGNEHTIILQQEQELEKLYREFNEKQVNNHDKLLIASELYALSYCDFMDRMAYLTITKKIPVEIAEKFNSYFEYIQLIMEWYDAVIVKPSEKTHKLRTSDERWSSIVKWCDSSGVSADTLREYLPDSMIYLWNESEK